MANPYSKYTGQRINPVPAGYLEANARAAANLQSGIASIGESIGRYYSNKRKKEEEEAQGALDYRALQHYMDNRGSEFTMEGDGEKPASELSPSEAFKRAELNRKSNMQSFSELFMGNSGRRVSDKVLKFITQADLEHQNQNINRYNSSVEHGHSAKRAAAAQTSANAQKTNAEVREAEFHGKGHQEEEEKRQDSKNREALVEALGADGTISENILNSIKNASTFDGALKILESIPEAQTDNLPANVKTWQWLKKNELGQASPEEVDRLRNKFFGIEAAAASKTANERDLELWHRIQSNPDLAEEEKLNAGYKLGIYTTKTHAIKFYENYKEKNPNATEAQLELKAKELGLPSPREIEMEILNHKKALFEEKERERAKEAWANKTAEVQEIPGAPYVLVRHPGSNYWTPLRKGSDGEEQRIVTAEEAHNENLRLEKNGVNWIWVQDLADPDGNFILKSKAPWSLNREIFREGGGGLPKDVEPPTVPQGEGEKKPISHGLDANAQPVDPDFKINPDGSGLSDGRITIQFDRPVEVNDKHYMFKLGRDGKAYYYEIAPPKK